MYKCPCIAIGDIPACAFIVNCGGEESELDSINIENFCIQFSDTVYQELSTEEKFCKLPSLP